MGEICILSFSLDIYKILLYIFLYSFQNVREKTLRSIKEHTTWSNRFPLIECIISWI